ncbi:hyalin-like [Amphiura filiformis]|uniref:hyalin-like n=1 Tax=Amphiura filiformis TaxID=82378 RepID=UPI003B216C39
MSAPVSWREPFIIDTSGHVTLLVKTHKSGERFGIGANTVMYMFADPSNNMAFCTFSVEVNSDNTYVPETCGRSFIFTYPATHFNIQDAYVMITTYSSYTVTVNVSVPGIGFTNTSTTSQTNYAIITFPRDVIIGRNEEVVNKTILITADEAVCVYGICTDIASADGFNVIPISSLGQRYVIASYEPFNSYSSEFVVTALEAPTVIEITFNHDGYRTIQKTLYPYESFQYRDFAHDLTGTLITSNKPISVMSGNECANVPKAFSTCDYLITHLPGTDGFGRNFVLSPFLGRISGYVFRVLAITNNTYVTVSDGSTVQLSEFEFYEGDVLTAATVTTISTDKDVIVTQYAKGFNSDSRAGDPFMLLVPPYNFFSNNVTFPVISILGNQALETSINVIVRCEENLKITIDGAIEQNWFDRLNSDGEFCVLRKSVEPGLHSVGHPSRDAKFVVVVYGFIESVSYAYFAGYNLHEVNTSIPVTEAPPATLPTGSMCNFESGWCGYEQADDDEFDWRLQSGATGSSLTGPSFDHTIGNGQYIYIEASSPRNTGDAARLLSPIVSIASVNSYNCTLQFWYHMYGAVIGALNVYTKSTSGTSELIWSLQGSQGDLWHLATAQFTPPNRQHFQIVYEGVRGTNVGGDIALDDISLPTCGIVCPKDSTAPVVSGCPDDVDATVELGDLDVFVNWTDPTATDEVNACIDIIVSHVPSTHRFSVGTTVVAYIFRDQNGNSGTCSFDVNVLTIDTTLPSITNCSNNIALSTELGNDGAIASWSEPSATDLSGTPQRIRSHAPSTKFPVGQTLVTYSFVDASNNTATCNFIVTVNTVDTTPPMVSQCPSDFDSIAGRHVTWREPDVFDLSENVTTIKSHIPGLFLTNQTQVLYTFTDLSGNTAFCNFTLNIAYDTTPPVISDCVDTVEYAELGVVEEPVYWTQPSATDDYGRVMLIYTSHTPGEKFPIGTTSVMYLFADDSYNIAYCNFSVVVHGVDTTPPSIQSCPSDIDLEIEPGTSKTPATWIAPSASDVSGTVSLVSQSHHPGDIFTTGKTEVVYSFTDGSNNEAFCSFQVNVREEDTVVPTVTNCPSDIIAQVEEGSISAPVSWGEPSAMDVSGNVTLLVKTHQSGERFGIGTYTVMYIFADSSNNLAFCTFSIKFTSFDTTPPKIESCPRDVSTVIELGNIRKTVYWTEPIVSDISDNVTLSRQSHHSGDDFSLGLTDVIYEYIDGSGNTAWCNFSVAVNTVDTTSPELAFCPEDIYQTLEIGTSGVYVSWDEPSASDKSGYTLLVNATHKSGGLFEVGSTLVRYTFVDVANNTATCEFHIHVSESDSRPPTILFCPSNMTVEIDQGLLGASVSWDEPVAEDASGYVMLLIQTHASGTFFTFGTTIVSYIFRDNANNMEKCSFVVTVTGDTGAVNHLRQSEGSTGGGRVSYAALVLSLLCIVFIICVVLVLVYFC